MSRKVLALIDKGSELEEISKRIETRHKFFHKTLEQLDKKKEKAANNLHEQSKDDWERVKELTKERLPEDFNDEKYHLTVDMKGGAIYCEDEEERIPPFIRAMMGKDKD